MEKRCLVLLAAYNGESFLSEQFDTILQQHDVDLDVIVSVDLSYDGTLKLCEEYSRKNKNITILPYGRKFGSAGKNFFRLLMDCDLSRCDYVTFSDQDDIWVVNKLSRATSFLEQYDCYSSNVTAFWGNGKERLIDKSQHQRKWDFLFEAAGPGCTYVFKKEIALEFKAWLVKNNDIVNHIELHDWLFYAFARSRGYSWFIDPIPMMHYRQHPNNQVGANSSVQGAIKRLRLINRKWYRNQVIKIAAFLELNDEPLVKVGLKSGYLGNLYLLFKLGELRRRFRDRFVLGFCLLLGLF